MSKFLSYVFLTCAAVTLSILVLIYGWGLHPKSWWWIIGGGFFGSTVIYSLRTAIEKESKK